MAFVPPPLFPYRSSLLPIFISKVTRSACLLACLHSSGSGTDLGYWEQVGTKIPMPWTRNNRIFSIIRSLFLYLVKFFKFTEIQALEDNVDSNAENRECRIEMDSLSNNSLVSQLRHQTRQPTFDGPNTGIDRNVANEEQQTMDGQDETFKSGVKVALWATSLSASGVTAVWTEFLVNQPNSPMCKFSAKAALLSMSASFSFGLVILILSIMRPRFDATAMIVKILIVAAIGSTTLVVGFGVAFYFVKYG